MSKNHDENKCLRSFSRIGKVMYNDNTLRASKSAVIGIHMWGKIDFLTKYCGWHFLWDNSAGVGIKTDDNTIKTSVREQKKANKEPKLANKNKRNLKNH